MERAFWDQYAKLYEDCLCATSTKTSPWHIVPADDKRNARLIIARVIIGALKSLGLNYPQSSPERRRELLAVRKKLAEE